MRSAASRSAGRWVGERAGEGSEATEPRPRAGRGLEAGTCKRSAQRARASAGDRDRHPKGEDRVSGLRGAGRGEAAPGRIEPGARSLDRAGALIVPVGQRAISGRRRPQLRTGHTGNQARNNGLLAVSDADRGGLRRQASGDGESVDPDARPRGRRVAGGRRRERERRRREAPRRDARHRARRKKRGRSLAEAKDRP